MVKDFSREFLLKNLQQKINCCHRCPLYQTAKHAVPGEGDPNTKIVFVGEAPGRVEDETGKPFVGRAGKLLDSLLASINLPRKSVFITSVIKHRPPKNRQPKSSEIKKCSYWLEDQLSIIKPKIIITLGRFGLEYFLPKKKISQIHGTIQKIVIKGKKILIFPVYHPAAGLRSTRNKKKLFADFQKLRQALDDII
jgi:DNA polymerase